MTAHYLAIQDLRDLAWQLQMQGRLSLIRLTASASSNFDKLPFY